MVEAMKNFPMDRFEEGGEKLTGIQLPPLEKRDMEFQQTACVQRRRCIPDTWFHNIICQIKYC